MQNFENTSLRDTSSSSKDIEPAFLIKVLLAAIISFIPLVVYLRLVPYEGISKEIFDKDFNTDFFTWYKMVWIILLSGASALWFLFHRGSNFVYSRLLVVYSTAAILSTVFAVHWRLALWGDPERHEGLIVNLCYVVILLLFFNIVRSAATSRFLMKSLLVSALIIVTIGISQFLGMDYFFSKFGTSMLISTHIKEIMPAYVLEKIQKPTETIFATFGNSNYTGIYVSMLFPLTFSFFLNLRGWKKFSVAVLSLALYIVMLGCAARSAMLAGLLSGVFCLFLFRKRLKNQFGSILIIITCFSLIPFVMDAYSLRNGQARFFSSSFGRPLIYSLGSYGVFNDLILNENSVEVVFDQIKLKLKTDAGQLQFFDSTGTPVAFKLLKRGPASSSTSLAAQPASGSSLGKPVILMLDETKLLLGEEHEQYKESANQIDNATFSASVIAPEELFLGHSQLVEFLGNRLRGFIVNIWPNRNILRIGRGGVAFFMSYGENGFKLLNHRGKPTVIREVESWGFKGREGFGSGRGYIWSRTFPLLRHSVLLGYGPDTFIAHFPNYDHLGKLRHWIQGMNLLIEKPHSLYLQIAFNFGLIALAAVLIFWTRYLFNSACLYFRSNFDDYLDISGAAIFVAILSYLVNGIFNDSMVGTAPVFWGLLGLGLATNRMVMENLAKNKVENLIPPVVQ